jgi:protein-S-isoprenylcysteine O-methyltransferase Ste14
MYHANTSSYHDSINININIIAMSSTDPLAVQRGIYGRNPRSNIIFTIGRGITGPAQYLLIAFHPLSRLSVPRPPVGTPPTVTLLGHKFPRLPFLTALMPVVLSIKHVLWLNLMAKEKMTTKFATFAIIADFVYECVSSLVFTAASVNPLFSEKFFYGGFTIFMASAAVELLAEIQRMAFKSKVENKGKLCTTGFWGITRHINYTANVMFGFGYGLATGGPVYACMTAGMYLMNFTTNAMPGIEKYCRDKYGEQWNKYEKDVPYQLIPGIY